MCIRDRKKSFVLTFFLILPFLIFSQVSKPITYFDLGLSYPKSKSIGLHASMNHNIKNDLFIDISANYFLFYIDRVPDNFLSGVSNRLEPLFSFSSHLGKKLKVNNSKITFIPKVGLSMNSYTPLEFKPFEIPSGFGASRSTYTRASRSTTKVGFGLSFGMDTIIPFLSLIHI